MKYDVVFVDMVYSKPYTINTLQEQGLGGTEATVSRVATALAKEGLKVVVVQRGRKQHRRIKNVSYSSPLILEEVKCKNVVNLRDSRVLPFLQQTFGKDSNYIQWCHDLEAQQSMLAQNYPILSEIKATVVGVSRWHKNHLQERLSIYDSNPKYKVSYIYNPVDDNIFPDDTERDRDKMVFLSSPHKGLGIVLEHFRRVRVSYPNKKLYVANPGYFEQDVTDQENVIILGSLPHNEVIQHLRTSSCLFYPNSRQGTEETYGLVVAESLAVGTPVIVHPSGSLREITGGEQEFYVDGRNKESAARKVERWEENQYPKAELKIPTRTSEVVVEWLKLMK